MLAVSPATDAQTHKSGSIAQDTTWTLAGSPYILDSTVTVNSGVSLTIEPGVLVEAAGSANNVLSNVVVRYGGGRDRKGTAAGGCPSNVWTETSAFTVDASVIELSSGDGIAMDGGTPIVSNCTIRDNQDNGIETGTTTVATITGNEFRGNGGYAILLADGFSQHSWESVWALRSGGTEGARRTTGVSPVVAAPGVPDPAVEWEH